MSPPNEMEGLAGRLAHGLEHSWRAVARPNQVEPNGDWWTHWLVLAGRGWGKSRTGAQWILEQVMTGRASRIALVAPTAADARDVMVEGESGLLACAPLSFRPLYEPSRRRLTWPNGAVAFTYSSEESERLRGPQHDCAWLDELASFGDPATFDMLLFGLRLGHKPRTVITTTPKPIPLIKGLIARENEDLVITRGSSYENARNLAPTFLKEIVSRYAGTRVGRQELNAEILDDVPGALWLREWLDRDRVSEAPRDIIRTVVAIDPAVSVSEGSDETGIIVAALGEDGHAYVLEDLSGKYAPHEWAKQAVSAYHRHKADRIVCEVNMGGDLCESTLRQIDASVPYRGVHASRGKYVRAEPISALYEQGRVHHIGCLPQLEDQMCGFTADLDRSRSGSPDRVDALVWVLTALMVDTAGAEEWIAHYRSRAQQAAQADAKPPPKDKLPWHRENPPKAAGRLPDMGINLVRVYNEARAGVSQDSLERICVACRKPIPQGETVVSDGEHCWHHEHAGALPGSFSHGQ